MNALDRFINALAPQWGLARLRARAAAGILQRHYDAASTGYRTDNWPRRHTDANAANGPAIATIRAHARDLHRNNGWAKNGVNVIGRNTVGWGILPKPDTKNAAVASAVAGLWKEWAASKQCDADGRSTFYGLQRQVIETVALSGEALVRMRPRRLEDGLAIPLQLQVLEPDLIDTTKDGLHTDGGGLIVQGVEFNAIGKRVAYWLYDQHPGSTSRAFASRLESRRIPASSVAHIYRTDRPGQVRGISWLHTAVVGLKDLDEYEDASLVRQKIAALFSVFVTDPDGTGASFGETDDGDPAIEQLTPGMIVPLAPGKEVTFASPPAVVDGGFDERALRKIAAGLGVTYEDLTGDYSKVNFSSARLARLAHWANVHDWRENLLIPQLCDVVWDHAMLLAFVAGNISETPSATWTPPPMPMIEPDREGLALMRLVRAGAKTPDDMVREQGFDPDAHWVEYAENLKRLDDLGIVIDSDARKVTQAGLTQKVGGSGKNEEPADDADREIDALLLDQLRSVTGGKQ